MIWKISIQVNVSEYIALEDAKKWCREREKQQEMSVVSSVSSIVSMDAV